MSYKGGDPGFVRVLDSTTIAFPCYDGNGMFYSMGNLIGNHQVGMLFVSFEKPHRLRVQGIASVDDNDPLLEGLRRGPDGRAGHGDRSFRNCPRYVHRYNKVTLRNTCHAHECETPLAGWKRVDDVQACRCRKKDRAARRAQKDGE